MRKQEEIVTLETYYNPMLAEIIRCKLEDSGIPCLVSDESLGALYPVYTQGGGGIKVKVFASDLQKAKEIVSDQPNLSPDTDVTAE
jgi:hypothetical protein